MHFLIPLGLLGLLSIIVLIIIYIIKPKYHDKAVSSTFIWKLSLKYKKRKMPLQWLKRSLLLILQTLILASLALMLARPFIELNTLSGEKVIILDASASMLTEDDGETRFDRALDEIVKIAERKNSEDRVTVILADNEASYVVRRDDSTERIKTSVRQLQCTYQEANIEDAMALANSVLDENKNAEVILYTDCDYEQAGYVTVENMSASEWNAAVMDLDIEIKSGYYEFTASVASYNKNSDLSLSLYVDDELRSSKTVSLNSNELTEVTFGKADGLEINEYTNAAIVIDADDSLDYDDELYVYGDSRMRNVELISKYSNMLNMALISHAKNSVYPASLLPSPTIYNEGYDLYVYEYWNDGSTPGTVPHNVPQILPNDGGVLIVNPKASILDLKIAGQVNGNYAAKAADGMSRTYQQLISGINASDIMITKYTKLVSYEGYEVIMTCNGDPVVLAKDFDGVKVVAVMFDIHDSTLPMLAAFPIFINNVCEYAAPPTLRQYIFDAGAEVEINAKPNASTVEILYESGMDGDEPVTTEYDVFPIELKADLPGTYTITQNLSNGKVRTDKFYVRTATAESDFSAVGGVLAADEYNPDASVDGEDEPDDVRYNILEFFKYIAILLLVLLVVEWGLQYREQF